jgi:tetratricopeptide (TPR) repeat protein
VPIDRAATLRNAEKLIRQGKIDAAIAEYVRIVEDQPQDWAAKNTLGDLYGRAGQADKAVQQFVEIANNLSDEGQMAKAGALYKKILKLKPDHEHSLMQVADVLAMQRLYADARAHLTALVQLREGRGDKRGALQAKARIGALDPEDYSARMMGVSARIEMGDKAGALGELKEMASELADKGRTDEAVAALREAATLHPGDDEVREKLYDVYVGAADYSNARECATSLEQLRMIAASQEGAGDAEGALETLRFAANAHADDRELRTELARKFVARGDMTTAAEYLTAETAGDDPELLLLVADIKLRGADADEGVAILRKLLEQDPARREQIALLGWKIAETTGEAGFKAVELAADSAVAQSDWPGAAAALQEFVTRVPNHIPALMRLVEICVDGGLEATMYSAQAQLADAYIAAGSATEARFIAEDLVAREPWESANIERFRKALELMGEPDPDALIASRLSGESPFMSTDLAGGSLFDDPPPPPPADVPAPDAGVDVEDLLAGVTGADEPPPKKPAPRKPASRLREDTQYTLSANAIDLDSILGGFDDFNEPAPPSPPQPTARASAASEDVEVDLSIVLDDIKPGSQKSGSQKPGSQPPPAAPPPAEAASAPADLDGVFGNLRDQASRRGGVDDGEKDYRRGLALRAAGDVDGCIQALEKASRSPKLRFGASWLIARLYRERDMLPNALEWLERASEAPAPTSDESNQLLYELAEGLEKVGEVARALAICLELQAEVGSYKDVDERIDRLTKVQAGS